jgi:STE24 endopeptidase
MLLQIIATPIEAIARIGLNAMSRQFEWQADKFAVELQDKLSAEEMKDMGDLLRKSLIKLHVKNLSTVHVDWL